LMVEQERAKADNLLNELMKDKNTRDFLVKKLVELNLSAELEQTR